MSIKNKVLIVASHPDDEILGCAGTVARLIQQGSQVYTLILGEGVTSRGESRDVSASAKEIEKLREDAKAANKVLGVKEVFFCGFPDNRFDTVAFIDIVKAIEKVKDNIKPYVVFTHYENDLNIDHQITFKAVLTATRPLVGESAKELYSFEVISSTEYRYPVSFSPDMFFDVSKTIGVKVEAMEKYKSELRNAPHPRSLEGIKLNAKTWGMKVGCEFAEAFKTIRVVR